MSSEKKSHIIVAMEGLIGVGKSTLCGMLGELSDEERSVEILPEKTNQLMLKLFYDNPSKYAFTLQYAMLEMRKFQLNVATIRKLSNEDSPHTQHQSQSFTIMDRSMLGDYAFALLNHVMSNISKEEMIVYESEWINSSDCTLSATTKNVGDNATRKQPKVGDVVVWMEDEPERCKLRADGLRRNASESGIPLSYYQGLDDIHFYLLTQYEQDFPGSLRVITWMKDWDCEEILKCVEDCASSPLRSDKIIPLKSWFDHKNKDADSETFLLYDDRQSIVKTYITLEADRQIFQQNMITQQISHVYFARDIMTVNDEELKLRGVNPDRVAEYENLRFYENEYKRVVYAHLSLGHTIYIFPNKKQ